jgi:hypothetical protein
MNDAEKKYILLASISSNGSVWNALLASPNSAAVLAPSSENSRKVEFEIVFS